MRLFFLCFCVVLLTSCRNYKSNSVKPQSNIESVDDFKLKLGEVDLMSKFEDEIWSIWGGTLVKGDDGYYHMFYSRWKKRLGWAWVTNSEIAHAVSKTPFGPFKFKDVALPARGSEYWDGLCTHNPTVHYFEGKYYLYYMGNTGDGKVTSSPGNQELNPIHRNNQRIGVAVSDSPNGPWERFNSPLIDVGSNDNALDALMVSNPTITKHHNGEYLMIYKAVGKKKSGIWGGPVVHLVATSHHPSGPFKKYDQPVFQVENSDFPAEDPFIWFQDGKYRAIVKDMNGAFTDAGRALVLFDSNDGFHWKLSNHPLVSKLEVNWKHRKKQEVLHLERPQLYLENGKPIALLCASDIKDEDGVLQSFNVQIPILE